MAYTSTKPVLTLLNPWCTFVNLWRFRELAWQFTLRNIEVRHKGSHLGFVWPVLNPLLMLGLYMFIFGYVFGGKFGILPHETRIDFALGIFAGLTVFQPITEVVGMSPIVIVTQPNLVKKVVFPLEILPAAGVGASLFHFLISLVLVIVGVALVGPGLSWSMLWLPVIVLPLILFSLGLSWLISSLGVFFRDIGQLTQFLITVLMYGSAVFYSHRNIPHVAWMVLRWNPVLHAVELSRDVLLWHTPVVITRLIYLYVFSLAVFMVGHAVFGRLKLAFADVL